MNNQDLVFLRRAIDLARKGMEGNHGGPFGAVIVDANGEVIGEGHNLVTSTHDPTAHAEVVAIRRACEKIGNHQLDGCTVYTSCEPCPMCLGAIYWARPARIVFACSRGDAADIGFDDDHIYRELTLQLGEREIPIDQYCRKKGWKCSGIGKRRTTRWSIRIDSYD